MASLDPTSPPSQEHQETKELKEPKRLRRSRDRKIWGVCGGIADYFNLDPTVVRVLWAVTTGLSAAFPGILLYLILATAMPGPDRQSPSR